MTPFNYITVCHVVSTYALVQHRHRSLNKCLNQRKSLSMQISKSITREIKLLSFMVIIFIHTPSFINSNPYKSARGIQEEALRVYIDYFEDDHTERYLRSAIPFVSYVRDPYLAQIHILISDQKTGSGGRKFTLSFIGQEDFEDQDQSLFYISLPSDTEDQRRKGLARIIKMGLMPYISQTSLGDKLEIHYNDKKVISAKESLYDAWDYWIFSVDLGGGLKAEESRNSYTLTSAINADRVTDQWKFRNELGYIFEEENFNDEGESLTSSLREGQLRTELIKSLSDKWSTGILAELYSTTYRNIKIGWNFAPAIEYNLFPWSESEKHIFTLAYHVGFRSLHYNNETIYDKKGDGLWYHSFKVELKMTQPWGNVDCEVETSQYLKLQEQYSIKMEVEFALRITRGWEFVLSSNIESIHDQIYLPKGDATRDEILLKRRQLATTYDIGMTLGFRYTFGSIYNNIINRRL